jgi:ankyrin repeat protein
VTTQIEEQLLKQIMTSKEQGIGFELQLLNAAEEGRYEVVKLLLEQGANLYTENKYGKTPNRISVKIQDRAFPLHLAAQRRQYEIVKLLIENGANLDTENKNGNTPLHLAAFERRYEIVKLLIEKGADLNTKNKDGDTPLHLAAQDGRCEIIKLLGHLQEPPRGVAWKR